MTALGSGGDVNGGRASGDHVKVSGHRRPTVGFQGMKPGRQCIDVGRRQDLGRAAGVRRRPVQPQWLVGQDGQQVLAAGVAGDGEGVVPRPRPRQIMAAGTQQRLRGEAGGRAQAVDLAGRALVQQQQVALPVDLDG